MGYLISIVVFLLIFSALILIHEFGHFYAARKAGVKVEEFGMGLPPRAKGLWKDKHGTLYSLNWIPFGGFVRMYGEDTTDKATWSKKGSFGNASIPWRTIIILGGVIMNFLLGYVILVGLLTAGTKPFVVTAEDFQYYRDQGIIQAENHVLVQGFDEAAEGKTAAEQAGVLAGDEITHINGQEIDSLLGIIEASRENAGKTLNLSLLREDQTLDLNVPVSDEGKMGVMIAQRPEIISVGEVQYPFHVALVEGAKETARLSVLTMKMFVEVIFDLFTKAELSEQVSGPVGIYQLTHEATASGSMVEILKLMALLSISLGAINVLPIPALDGGRFLSILFEVVTRKRPNAAWEAKIHAFGFIVIIILILAVTYQDIVRLIWG